MSNHSKRNNWYLFSTPMHNQLESVISNRWTQRVFRVGRGFCWVMGIWGGGFPAIRCLALATSLFITLQKTISGFPGTIIYSSHSHTQNISLLKKYVFMENPRLISVFLILFPKHPVLGKRGHFVIISKKCTFIS